MSAARLGLRPVLALVGPTASGKTSVAIDLAGRIGGEIVAVDSMTVYRGMDIGTAKPTREQRAAVPHHMLDVRDPGEPFSVAEFQREARDAVSDIRRRGRVPLLVGGSGLYLRAVVDDLEFPPTDAAVRARLEHEPPEALIARLRREDPPAAARIEPRNLRRVVRALEVIDITGRPFSSFVAGWDRYDAPIAAAGMHVPPDVLGRRIEQRVHQMLDAGLLDEVRALDRRGYRQALTSPHAVGYHQALAHLDGIMSRAEMVEGIVRNTRRLARRQMTWFRRDPRIRWFDASDIERAAREIWAYYEPVVGMEARAWSS